VCICGRSNLSRAAAFGGFAFHFFFAGVRAGLVLLLRLLRLIGASLGLLGGALGLLRGAFGGGGALLVGLRRLRLTRRLRGLL
jgi:hypothetical protein